MKVLRYEKDFMQPVDNPLVTGATKLLVGAALRSTGLRVEPTRKCLKTLYELRGSSTVLAPNHSDQADPLTVFALSNSCHEDFYYISARELFDQNWGLRGYFLQNCGAYSVIRGEIDRAYVRETVNLIKRADRKIIMFPEGDVTGLQSRTRGLKDDGIRTLFMGQKALLRQQQASSLYVVPLSIYYHTGSDVPKALNSTLDKLENSLGLRGERGTLETRIDRVCRNMIEHYERYYNFFDGAFLPTPHRIRFLCRNVISRLAELSRVDISSIADESEALHYVRGKIRRAAKRLQSGDDTFSLGNRKQMIQLDQSFAPEFERLQQLLILQNTLNEPFTPEMAWRTVDRLENQITGKTSAKGHRTAFVEAAEPINLVDYWDQFMHSREYACQLVAERIRHALDEDLAALRLAVENNYRPRIEAEHVLR